MKIISIDPGVMTGYCYAELIGNKLEYYPFQMVDEVDDLWRRLKEFKPDYAIIEDFEFRGGKRATSGLNLFSVQLIGVTRLYGELTNARVFIQKAAQGKSYYTDPVLKQIGLHKRGIPHAMDASRHLLQWCMFGFGNQFIDKQSTDDFATILDSWENARNNTAVD
jgi:hypothetical protein